MQDATDGTCHREDEACVSGDRVRKDGFGRSVAMAEGCNRAF